MEAMADFSISGLGSGIDWSAYISSIRNAEETALAQTLGRRQTKAAAVQAVLSNIKGLMDGLKSSASGFEFAKDFKTKIVSSSDSSVLTATANLSSINQTNVVRVEQLATNEVWHGTLAGVNSSVSSADGTLTITVRGQNRVFNVTAGTTLTQLAAQINAAGYGISATVFDTGEGTGNTGRIAITDNTAGKSNPDQTAGINFNMSFSSTLTDLNTAAFGVAPVVEGKDAQVQINGSSTMYRDSNTINDLLPGLTLNLVSADPGVDKTLTVSESSDAAATKIADFLNKYNKIVLEIQKAIKIDPTTATQSNPTAGNSTLRSVLAQLQSSVTSMVSTLPGGRTIRSLNDLGITSTFTSGESVGNGQLQLDQAKLANAISSNYDEVVEFFEGVTLNDVKYNGFGKKVSDALDTILNFSSGTLPSAIKGLENENARLDKEIQLKLERLEKKEQFLKDKFARLEGVLAQLSSRQSSLTAALNSINPNNNSSKK